jgi:hypothetical protein
MTNYRAALIIAIVSPPKAACTLPRGHNVAELLQFLNLSASHWWTCHNALDRLKNMTDEERGSLPDYGQLLAEAEVGLHLAESQQHEARQRLEEVSAMPPKWKAWPERRLLPRPDIW